MAWLVKESYRKTEGDPPILRAAKAHASVLEGITIFIEDGELIVGKRGEQADGCRGRCRAFRHLGKRGIGATCDGRHAGEALTDGTMSAMRGRDTHSPTALIKSAPKIDQARYQSTLLNMKFHPSALKTADDLKRLSDLIRTYFSLGGKHIQFNVVIRDTLLDAQERPENYRDLIVRMAGYSAFFVQWGSRNPLLVTIR